MRKPDGAAPPHDPTAKWWWLGTALATAAILVWFHRWSQPYLNVETEGTVQIPPERAAAATQDVSQARLERTVRALAGFGSRLSGSPGGDEAAGYLKQSLAEILGAGAVREEAIAIDNPFDLGVQMEVGPEHFRAHPFWAPVTGSYVLPPEGRDLGPVARVTLDGVLAASPRLSGAAATLHVPGDAELRALVLAAARRGVFEAKLRDPLTRSERVVLSSTVPLAARGAEDLRVLDVLLDKHRSRLADFLMERFKAGGARSVIFIEPAPAYRVVPRTFADRLLKHPGRLPRYLVEAARSGALAEGARAHVRQARAALTAEGGRTFRLHPLWPNLVRPASTPRGGLSGPLVWAGDGSLPAVKGKKLDGAIALVDFNCGYQWMNLANFGVQAVLFAEPQEIMRGESESKYLSVPAALPRYWVSRADAEALRALEGREVRVDAQVVWEHRTARTLVGRLPGTRPDADEEPVVIQAYYDSVSVVPGLSPGGEQACGAAALLELARTLKAHPLKKTVLFILTPGHCQNLTGWSAWLHRHYLSLAKRNKKKRVDPEYVKPAFVVHLDLTTRTRRLAVFYKGHRFDPNESSIRRVYSNFGKAHAAAGQAAAKVLGYGDTFMVDAINAVSGRTWDSYIPGRFALDQEVSLNAGLYGVAYVTPDDERAWVDTPHDTPERMDFESLHRQARVLCAVLPNVLNVGAAFGSSQVKNYATSLKGRVVEFDPRVSYLPDRTVNGAMVWARTWVPNKSLKGVRGDWFVMARGEQEEGGAEFELNAMAHSSWLASGWKAHVICEAYELDPMDGSVRFAPDRGSQGAARYGLETDMNDERKDLMLVTFPCRSFLMFDLVDPLVYQPFARMATLDARTDSAPQVYGQSLPEGSWLVNYVEPLAVAYVPEGLKAKFTFALPSLGKSAKRAALVNATPEAPEGTGYDVEARDRLPFTALRIAEDVHALNDFRLAKLKRHGIVNSWLDDLNAATTGRIEAARKALKARDYREAASEARAAWGLAARVYPDVENMAVDIIYSAMYFLALLIPFAFLAERLLIGSPNVTRQVGGALGIFLAMYLAVRAVHPAFQVALTPVMILLAFIIISLAIVVSVMVFSRFFNFLREEREASQGVHQADVSKMSVMLAAFNLGVSNMRKRVLRTALTCVTLVALTFAVLSLTSVLTAVKQKKYTIGKPAAYEGLLFRAPGWWPLGEPALRHLETELGGIAKPAPRAWFVSYATDRQNAVEITHGDARRATAVAALGMTAGETRVTRVDRCVTAGRWLKPGEARVCLLPAKLAATLAIGSGDAGRAQVVIFGVPFTVIGLFDPAALARIRDLDDEELSPVNFEATQKRNQAANTQPVQEGLLPKRYDHHDPGQVVIMPFDDLMRLGGRLASIAVPLPDAKNLQDAIKGLLARLGLLVYVGLKGKTYAFSAIGSTSAGGLDYIAVPVAVAALIVFSTMLGAVQERRREIGVFSSVGLAPNHVAVLFLAEAAVYAILGAVVGYLVGQAFSHLIVSGAVPFLKGLNVNYSSGSALWTLAIVILVTLGSAAYPAILAGRLARPSKLTGFDLPALVGDQVKLPLPFSFNARDAEAVCAFLAEHFDAHAEASAGEFSSGRMRLAKRIERGRVSWDLAVRVWLAPYDFGVSQDLTFHTREGIGDESSADLTITRLSGDQASWRRVNARFLKGIRKQFLIWRALGEPARARYQRTARELIAKGAKAPNERGAGVEGEEALVG